MTYTQQLEQAYRTHNPKFVQWIQKRGNCCKETAEDIMGDAWLRIIQKQLPPDNRLLLHIAIDLLRDIMKRKKLISGADSLDMFAYPEPEEQPEPVHLDINRLPESYKIKYEAIKAVVSDPEATGGLRDTARRLGLRESTYAYWRETMARKLTLEAVK